MQKTVGILVLWLVLVTMGITGCTENSRVKQFGGTMRVEVPKGNKVTNITWKGNDLWYSYRPLQDGEKPSSTTFQEESQWGVVEGTVIFTESK